MKKKLHVLLLLALAVGFFTPETIGQEIQIFGPGVHQDLDHVIQTRRICVPNPTRDVAYDFNKSFSDNVNDAIARERKAFGNTKIGDYVHPGHYTDAVDYAHKIITALRNAYSAAYDIQLVDVPLAESVSNAAQNHSCKMISCNQFTHQSSCTGSPVSRLSEQVGDWGSCLTGYSENIAINTSKTIEGAIEWAIFGMMYDDLVCCQNGHRENFLKCTYDDNWRMGFGYQKGKYSFGSTRSYDAWFMTWDYAKAGRSSGCGWDKDNGTKNCPAPQVVEIQNLELRGQSNCTSLEATWTASNTNYIQNLEVYQSIDNKPFARVASLSPQASKKYVSTFKTSGKEASIFVKVNTKSGAFYSSELSVFNVSDCSAQEEEEGLEANSEPKPDLTDNTPVQPEPEPETKPDPTKLTVTPNPARNYIKLSDVPSGTIYQIFTQSGRFAKVGIYRGQNIQIPRLRSGTYVITAGGRSGQFVKL